MKTIALISFTLLIVAAAAHAEERLALGKCLSQPGDEKKDDKAEKFPAPPAGYDTRRDEISHGKLETVEYDSTTVGVKRKARVYTPPGSPRTRSIRSCTSSTASAGMRTSGPGVECPT